MGYESKIYIVEHHSHSTMDEIIAEVNLSKMGHDGWHDLFTEPQENEMYGLLERVHLEDLYGEPLKFALIDKVLEWCNNNVEKSGYRRMVMLKHMLEGFEKESWGEIRLVHFGY